MATTTWSFSHDSLSSINEEIFLHFLVILNRRFRIPRKTCRHVSLILHGRSNLHPHTGVLLVAKVFKQSQVPLCLFVCHRVQNFRAASAFLEQKEQQLLNNYIIEQFLSTQEVSINQPL